MERIIDVANYIANKYREIAGEPIDEMKLHKLLYFMQRETIAITNEPAFPEDLEGWIHGPVSPIVRNCFCDGRIYAKTINISDGAKYIANNIIAEYGVINSWRLRQLSHDEISWQNARKGLAPHEIGDIPLKLDDIRTDARKIRPYDHLWDMYYDEFDDEGEVRVN